MTTPKSSTSGSLTALRKLALRYPEAQEGIACAGTSLEKRTVKARNKAFVFLGATDVMLKLRESLAEARKLAAKDPDRYKVGGHGWVKAMSAEDSVPPVKLLEKWVDESYRLIADKDLVALLPARTGSKAKGAVTRRSK